MKIYIKWFFMMLQSIGFTAYSWLFAGRIARQTRADWMLPDNYRNHQTPDAFMNGMGFGGIGKGGDRDFYEDHKGKPVEPTAKAWIRRNTGHGYRSSELGLMYGDEVKPVTGTDGLLYEVLRNRQEIGYLVRTSGDMTLEDHAGEGHFHYVYYDMDKRPLGFMRYQNIHINIPLIGQKRLRLKFGWDLWNMWWPDNTPRMLVHSVGIQRVKEET